jgi:hypothetical protein
MLRVLSLGAGVQSTTLALMALHGEIDPIDCAIFADTQSEPKAVYEHLSRLREVLPFPIHVVSKGSLRQELIDASEGRSGAWGRPPLFLRNPDGSKGMLRRQCTQDYKLDVIRKKVREVAGVKRGSPGPRRVIVEQLIGISIDEARRQRESRCRWIENSYPLVRKGITRSECLEKLAAYGWLDVPKSACTFCPYHSDEMWADMKANDPESFADAVDIDDRLRSRGMLNVLRGEAYLHASRLPLKALRFKPITAHSKERQLDFGQFGRECEGMCGV